LEAAVGLDVDPVAPPDDPAVRRLLPDAYDEPAGAAEFRRLTDADLRRDKSDLLTRLAADLDGADGTLELTTEQADGWARALNDIRLVVGVRLDVADDEGRWRRDVGPDDPRLPLVAAYDWLSMLQEMLLDALL
jgi:hypothetical protein